MNEREKCIHVSTRSSPRSYLVSLWRSYCLPLSQFSYSRLFADGKVSNPTRRRRKLYANHSATIWLTRLCFASKTKIMTMYRPLTFAQFFFTDSRFTFFSTTIFFFFFFFLQLSPHWFFLLYHKYPCPRPGSEISPSGFP